MLSIQCSTAELQALAWGNVWYIVFIGWKLLECFSKVKISYPDTFFHTF